MTTNIIDLLYWPLPFYQSPTFLSSSPHPLRGSVYKITRIKTSLSQAQSFVPNETHQNIYVMISAIDNTHHYLADLQPQTLL